MMNKMIEYSCHPFRYTELQSEFCVGDDDKTGKLNLHNVCNKHFVYPLSISVLQWGIQIYSQTQSAHVTKTDHMTVVCIFRTMDYIIHNNYFHVAIYSSLPLFMWQNGTVNLMNK